MIRLGPDLVRVFLHVSVAVSVGVSAVGGVVGLALLALPPSCSAQSGIPPGGLGESPGAFDLLTQVEVMYRELPAYADAGTLEVEVPGEPVRRFAFETAFRRPDAFALRIDRVAAPGARTPWRVLWYGPDGSPPELRALHWDADRDQVRTASSLAAELCRFFPRSDGGPDALPVPGLLLGLDVLAEPDAAALDGEEPCRGGRDTGEMCQVVALSRLAGAVSLRLWVERSQGWIRRAEVEIGAPAPAEGVPPPRPAPGAPDPFTQPPTRWTWEIEKIEELEIRPGAGERETVLAFVPPPSARRVSAWEPAPGSPELQATGEANGEASGAATGEATFGDVIDVTLTTLRVRVVDRGGAPIHDLGPEDFRVSLRPDRGTGTREPIPVSVAAVDWVESVGAGETAGDGIPGDGDARMRLSPDAPWDDPFASFPEDGAAGLEPAANRVLFFVQSDVHAVRTRGHVRFLPWVRDLLDQLAPGDPVAVVGYDSHLKLWQDFTLDREAAWDAVWGAIHFSGKPEPPRASERGPLYEHFDFWAAKKAAEPEVGLEVAARALVPFPGPKTVIWLGWGLGELASGRVRPKTEYRPALDALQEADATVFVIDVSDAAYHDLEHGLIHVAEDTGGTYAKAHERPDALVRNLTAAASGYYLLRLETGDLPALPGRLEVEWIRGPDDPWGRVLLPPSRRSPPQADTP